MANCISCGRELRTSLFGSRGNVCQDCRANAIDMTTAGSTATPKPRPRAVARGYPPVTTALVGINVAVFVMMLLSGVPLENPTIAQLLKWGANWGPLSLGAQPWRIVTSNYLHIGVIHIGLNMWCLWNLGILAERIFDRWTYVLTYTACGIAGSLGSLWWHPHRGRGRRFGSYLWISGRSDYGAVSRKASDSEASHEGHPEKPGCLRGL
ncbi:MAG: rhomboid family intramembrane serine protease [Terriglobales bacterium]